MRASNIPALMAVVVIAVAIGFADYQNREIFAQSQRTAVLDKLGLVRAQLEGNVNSNLQLIHGLVGVIATEPYMGQTRFSELAGYLFNQSSQII
ncbi:MAG: bifunctional diguanylate cyclase/phosphodiesterase, partial [Alphaproteobacteria bacterium]